MGAGILHQVAQFPIDQVYLIYKAPMPLSAHAIINVYMVYQLYRQHDYVKIVERKIKNDFLFQREKKTTNFKILGPIKILMNELKIIINVCMVYHYTVIMTIHENNTTYEKNYFLFQREKKTSDCKILGPIKVFTLEYYQWWALPIINPIVRSDWKSNW